MADAKDPRGAILGAGAAIAAAIALSRNSPAAASSSNGGHIDAGIKTLLEAIAEGQNAMLQAITGIEAVPGQVTIGIVPNTEEIACGRAQVAALNTSYNCPDLEVPDDMAIVLKAWPANGGIIFIGNTSPEARNLMSVYPLIANESIAYRIKNLNEIYFSGNGVGDWLCWTVEHRK